MAKKNKVLRDKTVSLFRKRRILAILLLIAAAASAVVVCVTIYGTSTGGFTVSVNDELREMGITLKESKESEYTTQTITGGLMSNATCMAQGQVNPNYVLNQDGQYISASNNYIGYTFYLYNNGTVTCNVAATFKITTATHHVDEAIRFWVFVDDEGTVYKKTDTEEVPILSSDVPPVDFDGNIVCENVFEEFAPGDYKKISIIMWIEGNDPDATDVGDRAITGGSIKVGMSFSAYKEEII